MQKRFVPDVTRGGLPTDEGIINIDARYAIWAAIALSFSLMLQDASAKAPLYGADVCDFSPKHGLLAQHCANIFSFLFSGVVIQGNSLFVGVIRLLFVAVLRSVIQGNYLFVEVIHSATQENSVFVIRANSFVPKLAPLQSYWGPNSVFL